MPSKNTLPSISILTFNKNLCEKFEYNINNFSSDFKTYKGSCFQRFILLKHKGSTKSTHYHVILYCGHRNKRARDIKQFFDHCFKIFDVQFLDNYIKNCPQYDIDIRSVEKVANLLFNPSKYDLEIYFEQSQVNNIKSFKNGSELSSVLEKILNNEFTFDSEHEIDCQCQLAIHNTSYEKDNLEETGDNTINVFTTPDNCIFPGFGQYTWSKLQQERFTFCCILKSIIEHYQASSITDLLNLITTKEEINLYSTIGPTWPQLLSSVWNIHARKLLKEENALSFEQKLETKSYTRYQQLNSTDWGKKSLELACNHLETILLKNGVSICGFFALLNKLLETRYNFKFKKNTLGFYGASDTGKSIFLNLIAEVMIPAYICTTSSEFALEEILSKPNNCVLSDEFENLSLNICKQLMEGSLSLAINRKGKRSATMAERRAFCFATNCTLIEFCKNNLTDALACKNRMNQLVLNMPIVEKNMKISPKKVKKLRHMYDVPENHDFVYIEKFEPLPQHDNDSSEFLPATLELAALYHLYLRYKSDIESLDPQEIISINQYQIFPYKTRYHF